MRASESVNHHATVHSETVCTRVCVSLDDARVTFRTACLDVSQLFSQGESYLGEVSTLVCVTNRVDVASGPWAAAA